MGEGDGEEKEKALLLNSIVKGGRGVGCSTAAASTALLVTAVAGALITAAVGTAVQASLVLKVVLVGAQALPSATSSADSAAVIVDSANSAAVWVATARSTAALECLARLAVEGRSGDGGDLATAA